jgi:23S rRNA (cytosine1962-C5)-methyltransferase
MHQTSVILKEGKDKAIRARHHWIFSGAIASYPTFTEGDVLPVLSYKGELLGSAYFNRKAQIAGRMVAFDATPPLVAIRQSLEKAIAFRKRWFFGNKTTAYRLVNGEGDCLPGLIVDQYEGCLVVQFGTLGMEKLKAKIVTFLQEILNPRSIYEKSILPARKEEGLPESSGLLAGELIENIQIKENGLLFEVSPEEGQKTGFFLDHREMRQCIRNLSQNKTVLNCFSYTGGFSVYALAGGATRVDSVDISAKAVALARKNVEINGFDASQQGFFAEDVFQYLREKPLDYDIVILDPPAFAKRKKDIIPACRGYKDINRIALKKMPAGSILLTCSCSYHIDEVLFQKVVFQAAVEANRNVRIIGRHEIAPDHPINICHPESDYLKSLLLYVD